MNRLFLMNSLRKGRKHHLLPNAINRNGRNIHLLSQNYFSTFNLQHLTYCQMLKLSTNLRNILREHYTSSDNSIPNQQINETPAKSKKCKNVKVPIRTTITAVTNTSTKQTNATVQLFRKKQLSEFLKQPLAKSNEKTEFLSKSIEEPVLLIPYNFPSGLNSNTQFIEKVFESYRNFTEMNNLQRTIAKPKPINEKTEVYKTYQNFIKTYNSQLKIEKENKFSSRQFSSKEYKELSYHESLCANLKAYLNACVSAGMHNRGLFTLLSYRKRQHKSDVRLSIHKVDLYEILLTSYAAKANWSKILEICTILNEDKITYTPQVYAAICECLGREKVTTENLKLLQKFTEKAKEENISLNDIMDKSMFISDQREIVLNAIRRIEPNFQPKYTPPFLTYTNPLLESLNENIRPIEEKLYKTFQCPVEHGYEIGNAKKGVSLLDLERFTQEQLEVEISGHLYVKNISKISANDVNETVLFCRKKVDQLFTQWRTEICNAIKRNMGLHTNKMNAKSAKYLNIFPYVNLLKPEQYADIMIEELKWMGEGSETYTPTTLQLYKRIGEKVLLRYKCEARKKNGIIDKTEQLYSEYRESLCTAISSDNPRQLWQRINYHARDVGPNIEMPEVEWPWPVLSNVGQFLFKILLEDIKIDINLMNENKCSANYMPVLYSIFRSRDLVSREELRPHPTFTKLYRGSQPEKLTFLANLVPMMCPPIPWTSPKSGGYIITHSDLIRLPYQAGHQLELINERPITELYPALDALNQLASIAWCINTKILDIAIEVFNSGGSEKMNIPLTPNSLLQKKQTQLFDEMQFGGYSSVSTVHHHQEQAAMYSLWCDTLYKLSLANHFRDRTFWLPHNMDFRGRVYPVPPHLNHLSSDMSRSLLLFHQKQPLGENGLNWLKLHCINLTGLKKRNSIQDRLDYAEVVLDDILDSADNPLNGRQWWLQSDEPWQTLATCIEISNAIRTTDPTTYMSSFPIHQDGSCNGLQHYAALGRDQAGAVSVNLVPSEVPQDVYSTVANLVEKSRKYDADNGNVVAAALNGHIKRKVVKQTVMTTVYGVTPYGARLQIEKQLKNIDDFDQTLAKSASNYLTSKTFTSLRAMFTSAREIQNWFTECARFISQQCHHHVEWITPLGLPIVQPYVHKSSNSSSNVLNITSQFVSDKYRKLNNMKEKNAFPPNFVHSLDSCHMMLTSLHCEKAGLTFVSVHDCFWTHANTVPIMNKICREQFLLLHSQPILEDLSKYFIETFDKQWLKDNMDNLNEKQQKLVKENAQILGQLPKKGKFHLEDVLKSVYFFS